MKFLTYSVFILPHSLFQRSILFFHLVKQTIFMYLLVSFPVVFTFASSEGLTYCRYTYLFQWEFPAFVILLRSCWCLLHRCQDQHPDRHPGNCSEWVTSWLQRAVAPVASTRTSQFPIEEPFQSALTGVADRVMKDKFHNAKGRGADNEIRELTPDPVSVFFSLPLLPSLFLSLLFRVCLL